MVRRTFLHVAVIVFCSITAFAQRSAGDKANIDPLYLIDIPVAGILPATSGSIESLLYPGGGVLISAVYGIKTNLNLGFSYGGTGIIGSGEITWDNMPGILVRYRLLEENQKNPAIVVGFDSQGRDGFITSEKRYVVKSPGFFVTAGKNYELLGLICFNGGVSYTLERYDKNSSPNVFVGIEKTVGPIISFLGEYNFAFDNQKIENYFWSGYLNLGLRFSTNIGLNADIQFKNLLSSAFYYPKMVRTVRIQYVRYL